MYEHPFNITHASGLLSLSLREEATGRRDLGLINYAVLASLGAPPTEDEVDYADCHVSFYSPVPDGVCPGADKAVLDTAWVNASSGTAGDVCVAHNTTASGAHTPLFMTLKPQCKAGDKAKQTWMICSYVIYIYS